MDRLAVVKAALESGATHIGAADAVPLFLNAFELGETHPEPDPAKPNQYLAADVLAAIERLERPAPVKPERETIELAEPVAIEPAPADIQTEEKPQRRGRRPGGRPRSGAEDVNHG